MSHEARASPTALRPLKTSIGSLARVDGSASFSFGPLETMASVTGPAEVRLRDELTDRATLDVIFQPLNGVAGVPSKTISYSFHTLFSSVLLLHHHPRSMIQLVLQTLSLPSQSLVSKPNQRPLPLGPDVPPSPSEKACMINAASLALLDAGILARGTVASCACAILPYDHGVVLRESSNVDLTDAQVHDRVRQKRKDRGELSDDVDMAEQNYSGDTIILLDPTPTELQYALSTHVFAFCFSSSGDDLQSDQVFADSQGEVDMQDLMQASKLCREASKAILGFIRQATTNRVESQVVSTEA